VIALAVLPRGQRLGFKDACAIVNGKLNKVQLLFTTCRPFQDLLDHTARKRIWIFIIWPKKPAEEDWDLSVHEKASGLFQLPFSKRHFVLAAGVHLREWVAKKFVNHGRATFIDRTMPQCLHFDGL